MNTTKLLAVSLVAAGLIYGTQSAQAHCDSIDGPVAQAALAALDTGNPNLVLPYAPAVAEAEIKAAFARSTKVRALGPEAKALADRAFMETTVRLHRAGEGAAYTGLKPAGTDFGPAIPAAEQAIESGDPSEVKALLEGAMEHGLETRSDHVLHMPNGPEELQSAAEVATARERISAEFGFVEYVEGLRQAIHGDAGADH